MRRNGWQVVAFLLLAATAVGCQNGPSRRSLASSEPTFSPPAGGTAVVSTPAARPVTFVDRHPLFSKPREYYESSGDNRVVKSAAAVVVGVPAGVYGELKQIVVGSPAPATSY
jgi:hypothetical protein